MNKTPFESIGFLSKLILKFKNKQKYRLYKWEQKNYDFERLHRTYTGSARPTCIDDIRNIAESNNNLINVSHSGNAGDIIYALPALKKLYEETGIKSNFYLRLNVPLEKGFLKHPVGSVMLNQRMASRLIPLLEQQEYVYCCLEETDQTIHIDLDYFRSNVVPIGNSNIARWSGYLSGISPELWQPWLNVEKDTRLSEYILLARSTRYRNANIDFGFLRKYKQIAFTGIQEEFDDLKKQIPHLTWIKDSDFLETARLIAGCKLFIGNQSFPYSIAEGLKVNRIMEASYHYPNVLPEGPGGHDFFFQKHFEWLVENLYQ